jgi:malate synthase
MAAQIPIKNDAVANEAAMDRVRADKKREAGDGHDGTWVAHPGLVAIAKSEFDAVMKGANQIARKRQDVHISAADLIAVPEGTKTEAGLRQNVAVGIGYVEAWLRGIGCVPLFNLMEDAATAEISRAQVWQWVRHRQTLQDGRPVTKGLVREIVREENDKVKAAMGEEAYANGRYEDAAQLMIDLVEQPTFEEFLTLPAYERILADEKAAA